MKIYFDSQIFQLQEYGGISRYFSELISAIKSASPDESVKVGAKFVRNRYIVKDNDLHLKNSFKSVPKRLLLNIDSKRSIPTDVSILHSTYYNNMFLPRNLNIPNVITIHDMIPEDFSEMSESEIQKTDKARYILNADGIICVSNFTMKRLTKYFPNLKAPIEVIPLASNLKSDINFDYNLSSFESRTRDFIYVGPRYGYKNFKLILEATEILRISTNYRFRIIAVGGGKFSAMEEYDLAKRGLSNIVVQNEMNDFELSRAYSTSLALIYPSLSEGFGIPQIEAFSFGCPVISSNLGALREYGEGISLNFDAASAESLAHRMLQMLTITPLDFERISEQSIIQSKKFSWLDTATKTTNFYKKLI